MSCTKIRKELYLKSEIPGAEKCLSSFYTGKGIERTEGYSHMSRSDISDYKHYTRASDDNGKTWTCWRESANNFVETDEYIYDMHEICRVYNPVAGHMVQMRLRRLYIKETPSSRRELVVNGKKNFFDHVFCEISNDQGKNWGNSVKLEYEKVPAEAKEKPLIPDNLVINAMMGTVNTRTVVTPSGKIIHPVMIFPRKLGVPKHDSSSIYGVVYSILVIIGEWDKNAEKYIWFYSKPLYVSPKISKRGVFEPFMARLSDGRLMLDMRGSNTEKTPGRRWYSISNDEGVTWSEITDLRYDTGEQFYSPSSMNQIIRSIKTGKLYWVGNITNQPPEGNSPRYPLVIAQVKEKDIYKISLIKDSVTIIDTKLKDDSDDLQLSNFKIIENRETLNFELYVTRFLSKGRKDWTSDVFKYSIIPG